MSNANAAREGERRREARPHHIGDVTVLYRRLYSTDENDENKATIIIKIPNHDDLVIGPLPSSIAKEMFDSIRQPREDITPSEIKVGDRVRVRGDESDFTEHLDGKVGVVVQISHGMHYDNYTVTFDNGEGTWNIWSYNIVEVLRR